MWGCDNMAGRSPTVHGVRRRLGTICRVSPCCQGNRRLRQSTFRKIWPDEVAGRITTQSSISDKSCLFLSGYVPISISVTFVTSICLSVFSFLFICLYVCQLSVCLSICLSVWNFVFKCSSFIMSVCL